MSELVSNVLAIQFSLDSESLRARNNCVLACISLATECISCYGSISYGVSRSLIMCPREEGFLDLDFSGGKWQHYSASLRWLVVNLEI